jgi:tRNA threonylcarbamoyladenosine biosynthesis protein TsaB
MLRGLKTVLGLCAVRRLLQQLGWGLAELDAVGVVAGPGSFTGVRTGIGGGKGIV